MSNDHGSAEPKPPQGSESRPDLFEAYITVTRKSFAELMRKLPLLDLGCRPHIDLNPDGTGNLQAFASEESIRAIEASGYRVQKGQNVSALGRERQKEVGVGDRFQGGRVTPRGLGRKPGGRR